MDYSIFGSTFGSTFGYLFSGNYHMLVLCMKLNTVNLVFQSTQYVIRVCGQVGGYLVSTKPTRATRYRITSQRPCSNTLQVLGLALRDYGVQGCHILLRWNSIYRKNPKPLYTIVVSIFFSNNPYSSVVSCS